MKEKTLHFAVGRNCHTCSPVHTALWWWRISVCVGVWVSCREKPCLTPAVCANLSGLCNADWTKGCLSFHIVSLVFCAGSLLLNIYYFWKCSEAQWECKPEQPQCGRKNITTKNALQAIKMICRGKIASSVDSVISLGRHYSGNQAALAQRTTFAWTVLCDLLWQKTSKSGLSTVSVPVRWSYFNKQT